MNGRNSANSQYFPTHLQPIVLIWPLEQCLLSMSEIRSPEDSIFPRSGERPKTTQM